MISKEILIEIVEQTMADMITVVPNIPDSKTTVSTMISANFAVEEAEATAEVDPPTTDGDAETTIATIKKR